MKIVAAFLLFGIGLLVGWQITSPDKEPNDVEIVETPVNLEKYSIESLASSEIKPGEFIVIEKIEENNSYSQNLFKFTFSPSLDDELKSTTVIINIPKGNSQTYPLVVLFVKTKAKCT